MAASARSRRSAAGTSEAAPRSGQAGGQAPSGDRVVELRAGFEALTEGRFEQARERIRPFVQAGDFETQLLYGLALGGCGDADAAAVHLTAVAAARPAALHPCLDLVSLLSRRHRVRESEPVFLACLALAPADAKLQLAHGQLLTELFRFEEALAAVDESLRLQPASYAALNQRGIVLVGLGRIAEGLATFRRVVAEDPGNSPAWANLGCSLTAEGAFEEALAAYRRSIQIKPAEPHVRLNHSITLLKAGRMVQGWQEHEWRFRLPGHTQLPLERMLPNVGPATDLAGRSVLVTHEEGVGDTLMFLRYVPALARTGARVVLSVPPNLARLAARVEGVSGVTVDEEVRLECDWHCPFISLPRAFASTRAAWGAEVPYLHADPELVARAGRRLPPRTADAPLRVGVVWGGAPRSDNLPAFTVDQKRSMSLRALAPLGRLRGVSLVSLQFGPYAAELREPPAGLLLHDPMGAVREMDDTASLVRNLDVVVSVDTSIVHLAGGLGVPVILMDRYDNCWRWLHGREDSPWYPSLRIVRQTRPGEWGDVVARVVAMLQAMADGTRGV